MGMSHAMKRLRRTQLLRAFVRLIGARDLHRLLIDGQRQFPRPTDPASVARLLAAAREHVPYYRAHLPAVDPREDPVAALAAMRFRTPKAVIKQDVRQLMDDRYRDVEAFDYKKAGLTDFRRLFRSDVLIRANTSGTSGRPLEFFRGKRTLLRMFYSMLEEMHGLGWEEGDAILSAWQAFGPPRATPVQLALRALGFPLFTFRQIDDAACRAFFDMLDRQVPAALFGFPSYYLEFARFRLKTGHRLRTPPKFVLCGGEMLADDQRALLEQAFEAPVYNSFGGNEFGFVACECRARQGLHVIDHAYVAETDEQGHLLLTTLEQREMPLIKYETGDRVVIGHDPCPCGVAGARILRLDGRIEDYLLNGDGKRVFSRYFREVLLEANRRFDNQIVRAQFVQQPDGRLRFALQLIDGAARSGALPYLQERLHGDLNVPASGSLAERLLPVEGKFKFLVREDAA
jgi:phenylacetate-coenzyme A ligase PaaK-like adenylate-forming protein